MIPNPFLHRAALSDVEAAILLGLRKYGRRKTFIQILEEASISATDAERFDIAFTLEADGYINDVTYYAPITIRAALSAEGEKVADSLADEHWLSTSVVRAKAFH